jgi:hypothetical protein
MSSDLIQWIAVLMFFLLFWGFTAGEAFWLKQRQWASFQRSLAFAVTSNLFGFFIGSGVVLALILFMFMLTFEKMTNPTLNEAVMWVLLSLVFIFPPFLLLLVKRLSLKIFKMETGRPAWRFSLITSLLIVFGSGLLPGAFLYIYLTYFDRVPGVR